MDENKTVKNEGQFEKYPYSFELRINDNIVCQRYFKINGFREASLYSNELTDTLRYCAKRIQNDLASKSRLFIEYTAPQIFKDEAQLNEWLWWNARKNLPLSEIAKELGADENGLESRYNWDIQPRSYVILEDEDKTYFWDGDKMELYTKYFNRNDYLPATLSSNYETPCVLKLAFLVNDVEICSTEWDGNVYPRFIRTNIDLSNSKNKYKTGDNFSPFEAAMVDIMNEKHDDLIPVIVREFCLTCSDDEEYTTQVVVNGVKYKNSPSHRIFSLTRNLKS